MYSPSNFTSQKFHFPGSHERKRIIKLECVSVKSGGHPFRGEYQVGKRARASGQSEVLLTRKRKGILSVCGSRSRSTKAEKALDRTQQTGRFFNTSLGCLLRAG